MIRLVDTDEAIECDHVVVTVSAGVLKAEHMHLFHPQLPTRKLRAIEDVGFDTVDKVVFVFPEKFWDDEEYIQLGASVTGDFDETVEMADVYLDCIRRI